MAKMGGDQAGASAEDKDQLNYHVVLIGMIRQAVCGSMLIICYREYASL